MATRSPMSTVSGSTSVSSTGNRPPPSKSSTAKTIGRAGRVGQPVDGVGGDGGLGVGHVDRVHVVDGAALHRDPRRRQVHGPRGAVAGPDEAELPVLVAPGRRGRDPLGLGPPGRLGGDHAPPRQELAVGEVGAGGDLVGHRIGRGPRRRGPRWCGTPARRRRRPATPRPPPGRAGPARAWTPAPGRGGRSRSVRPTSARSSASAPSRTPSLRARALTARACMPVTATRSTWSAVSPAAFRADSQASVPSGT